MQQGWSKGLVFATTIAALASAALPARAASSTMVISELRTRGPNGANDEFIELYNLSPSAVTIAGWKIKGSSTAASVSTRATIPAGTVVNPGCHYLVTNASASGYSGAVVGDLTYTTGVTDDGGIAVTLPDDTVVDQLGLSTGSAFKEGSVLTALTTNVNRGYERKPGGVFGSGTDSDDNSADFAVLAPSDPQNSSSACLAATPTATATATASSTRTPTHSVTATSTNSPTYSSTATEVATASPTPTPTATDLPTASPTPTLSETATASPTDSPTCTPSATDVPTVSPTATETAADTATETPTPTDSPTATASATETATLSPTATDTPTNSPTCTPTSTVVATASPTSTQTQTATDLPTASPTPTPSETATASPTDSPTCTSSPTDVPTAFPTPTETPTNTATETPTPTDSPTATAAASATATTSPTATDTETNTPSETATTTSTPTATASDTSSPTQTAIDSATATPTHTVTPSTSPTATATESDTPTVTPSETDTASPTPTDIATGTPTQSPTPTPTPLATATRSSTPSPTSTAPPACGNGVLDTGEECDDGNQNSGDLCPSGAGDDCRYTASGSLIRGQRMNPAESRHGCQVEWYVVNPTNPPDAFGSPSPKQTCVDQDPSCDFDPTPGRCRFRVVMCLNNQDADLPACAPNGIRGVSVLRPAPQRARLSVLRNILQADRFAVESAANHLLDPTAPGDGYTHEPPLTMTQHNFCSAPFAIDVFPAGLRQRSVSLLTRSLDDGHPPRPQLSRLTLTCRIDRPTTFRLPAVR